MTGKWRERIEWTPLLTVSAILNFGQENFMRHNKWTCLRCSGKKFEAGEIRVSGGFWSRIFDVQNKKYSAVTCDKCGYTEFYKREASTLGNVFDFFTR